MEHLRYGFMVLVIGMAVVLVALTGLALIMNLMKAIFQKDKQTGTVSSVKERESVTEMKEKMDHGETVAAISAALAVYLGRPPVSFNVISINYLGKSNWLETGKQELLQANITNKM